MLHWGGGYEHTWQDWGRQVALPFVAARRSRCVVWVRVLPGLQQLLCLAQQNLEHVLGLPAISCGFTYLLLARIADVLVGVEKGSDIDCLSTPELPVDGPVKRQFQGAPVERPRVDQ